MATDPPKRSPGRPPNPNKPTDSLGSVRVHPEQLEAYSAAADDAGTSRADWIRDTLDRAARRRRAARARPRTIDASAPAAPER